MLVQNGDLTETPVLTSAAIEATRKDNKINAIKVKQNVIVGQHGKFQIAENIVNCIFIMFEIYTPSSSFVALKPVPENSIMRDYSMSTV